MTLRSLARRWLPVVITGALAGGGLVTSAYGAEAPPFAATGPADVLGASAVTAFGTLNDAGQDGTWWFEYVYSSMGMDFRSTSARQTGPASTDDQHVSQQLPNIAGGSNYSYRLVLETAAGIFTGDWLQFTTPTGILKVSPPRLRMSVASTRLHIARDHTIPVRIGCAPGTAPCSGTVVVKTSTSVDAIALTLRKHVDVDAARRVVVRVRLSREGRRRLGHRHLSVTAVLIGAVSPGSTQQFAPIPLSLR